MPGLEIQKSALYDLLASDVVDFLDLGSGGGRSYEYIRKTTGLRVGVSLDANAERVSECRKVNDLAFVYDVRDVPYSFGAVSATFMLDFLQHLSTEKAVLQVIQNALVASRDYVFIRQPYFDHDEELARLGFRTYWSGWQSPENHMDLPFMAALLRRCGPFVQRLRVFGIDRIIDSSNPAVLPLAAPPSRQQYQEALHGPKARVAFAGPSFRELLVILERQSISEESSATLAKLLKGLDTRAELLAEASLAQANASTDVSASIPAAAGR